jgi:hypothetical protein
VCLREANQHAIRNDGKGMPEYHYMVVLVSSKYQQVDLGMGLSGQPEETEMSLAHGNHESLPDTSTLVL